MLSFHGGQMGCFVLRFSHAGRRLAAACADRDAFPIVGVSAIRLTQSLS